ncbi:MAG: NAD(P)/FAD-dependent oxidoreductase [Granulosicoccus sp.]|nr:NAD(P)/FAD-dependent oxidoreductase [Granulosicoccus sp.]
MSQAPHIRTKPQHISVVIVGAGHAGLAVSRCLSEQDIEHVVLERGDVANTWRTERWQSLRLLTPNWQNDLPGYSYRGDDPDGFMACEDVVSFISDYASKIKAPVRTHTTVLSITRSGTGYLVQTDRGEWECRGLVLASGACNQAAVPSHVQQLPNEIQSLTPLDYQAPQQLPKGGVLIVGASATGLQLAEEIQKSGRKVTISVGEHVRLPRRYRQADIHWWMDKAGILDQRIEDQDDPQRARRLPSPQLIGSAQARSLDLNKLQSAGIDIVGRLAGIREGHALFSGSLRNCCAMADQKQNRLLDLLDQWASDNALDHLLPVEPRPKPTRVPERPKLQIDLTDGSYSTVIWASGYRPDYSWLHLPVINKKGMLIHERGVVGDEQSNTPGMFAMGLPFMRRRKSGFISGAKNDAKAIAALMRTHLDSCKSMPKQYELNTDNAFDVAC